MQTKEQEIAALIRSRNYYLVGIGGIPGAGKSTLAARLASLLPHAIVLPLDGFHLYRKDLNEEGLFFRGAPHTFDFIRLREKVRELRARKGFPVLFPSFDHAAKDPVEEAIVVGAEVEHVIVEGIYLFGDEVGLEDCWDLKLWVDCNLEEAMRRLTK
jgi:pantothenate kinase